MSEMYLIHSIDEPKNDELYHWKYTRRYMKNGKWRYLYDYKITGKGYKRDAYAARSAAKEIKRSLDLTSYHYKWNGENGQAKDGLSFATSYNPDSKKTHIVVARTNDALQGQARAAKSLEAKANIAEYKYANESLAGKGEAYIKKLLKR